MPSTLDSVHGMSIFILVTFMRVFIFEMNVRERLRIVKSSEEMFDDEMGVFETTENKHI